MFFEIAFHTFSEISLHLHDEGQRYIISLALKLEFPQNDVCVFAICGTIFLLRAKEIYL